METKVKHFIRKNGKRWKGERKEKEKAPGKALKKMGKGGERKIRGEKGTENSKK